MLLVSCSVMKIVVVTDTKFNEIEKWNLQYWHWWWPMHWAHWIFAAGHWGQQFRLVLSPLNLGKKLDSAVKQATLLPPPPPQFLSTSKFSLLFSKPKPKPIYVCMYLAGQTFESEMSLINFSCTGVFCDPGRMKIGRGRWIKVEGRNFATRTRNRWIGRKWNDQTEANKCPTGEIF